MSQSIGFAYSTYIRMREKRRLPLAGREIIMQARIEEPPGDRDPLRIVRGLRESLARMARSRDGRR